MKHSLEERIDIGRRMYLHEITYKEAMEIYGLSESCAHKYMTDYKKAQGIPLANTVPKMKNLQCVVSDMTAFHLKGSYYELTLFMDLWNNEILSYSRVSIIYMSILKNKLKKSCVTIINTASILPIILIVFVVI
ncbi:hypothetical protein [Lachnospira eligens]|uniref:Uncharacterized protein n=1 Tax=Lachnospira eligens TaxID=39485 RepID=A0A175A325_9FIRM|nr:hypothetical protein [Lachnospira eligens]CUQ92357.1 Uncharacterised protein [Lachnospira eligens]